MQRIGAIPARHAISDNQLPLRTVAKAVVLDVAAEHCRVRAITTRQRVITSPTRQRVIARATIKLVIARAALQRINARAAIGLIVAAVAAQKVIIALAQQRVVAIAAIQRVVARAAKQCIVTRIANQPVAKRRTFKVINPCQRVACRIAARPGPGGQIDRHSSARSGITGNISATRAIQRIGPGTAHQRIRPRPTIQRVRPAVACQAVIVRRPDHILDPRQCITRGIATRCSARRKVYRNAGCAKICDRIRARATHQTVGPRTAVQQIVAVTARQRITVSPTDQRVVTQPAIERIGTDTAIERIIPCATSDAVIACCGVDSIIAIARQNGIRPVSDRVAICIGVAEPHGIGIARTIHNAGIANVLNFAKGQRAPAAACRKCDRSRLVVTATIADGLHIGVVQHQRIAVRAAFTAHHRVARAASKAVGPVATKKLIAARAA